MNEIAIEEVQTRDCYKCNRVLPLTCFHKHKDCYAGYNSVCKECRKPISKAQFQKTSKQYRLFNSARSRAKILGREFSISMEDVVIPEICPVFKCPMVRPSLDRIDSNKGYIPGNVRVISYRANSLKNNATIEEMELILEDMKLQRSLGLM